MMSVSTSSNRARWLVPAGTVAGLLAAGSPAPLQLTVSTRRGEVSYTYLLSEHREGGALLGYRLRRVQGDRVYDLHKEGNDWECDCPSGTYTGAQCKHSAGLVAALKAAGIPC